MVKTPATPPFPITGLTRCRTTITDELHFTGGLRAVRFGSGWQIGPFLREGGLGAATGVPEAEIGGLGNAMGVRLFGADEITAHDPNLPAQNRPWQARGDTALLAGSQAIRSHRARVVAVAVRSVIP